MKKNNLLYLIFTSFLIISCYHTEDRKNPKITKSELTTQNPKIEVNISTKNTVLSYGDKILLNISLKNKQQEEIEILFDKVTSATPWGTRGKVNDKKTKKSQLKYEEKVSLSSQVYTDEELKNKYSILKTNEIISREYDLNEIVIFDNDKNLLPKGEYEVQIYYYDNASNILTITIR